MTAAMLPGHALFAPVTRQVFYVEGSRGSWLFLREVHGSTAVRIDLSRRSLDGMEDLGHPGQVGPCGWMALRDGVIAAEDHAGRVEAVRTAGQRATCYGPAVPR